MLNDRGDYWVMSGIVGAIGLLFLWGAYTTSQEKAESRRPTCNGEAMGPGDVCTIFRGRHGITHRTYEEIMSEEWEWNTNDTMGLVAGVGLMALSVGIAVKLIVRPPAKASRSAAFDYRPSPKGSTGRYRHLPVPSGPPVRSTYEQQARAFRSELSAHGVEELKSIYHYLYEGKTADRSAKMGAIRDILVARDVDVKQFEAGFRGNWYGQKKAMLGAPPFCFGCKREHWTAQPCVIPT